MENEDVILNKINNCMATLDSVADTLMRRYESEDTREIFLDCQLIAIFRAKRELNNMLIAYEGEKERKQKSGSRRLGTKEDI